MFTALGPAEEEKDRMCSKIILVQFDAKKNLLPEASKVR
jgi:hypothetical protein